ncbi:MAG TPA: kelch repeat-containing protein [Bacteroidia bacterium]|nr:kelch repeat-containing protein [Bacteroidia bacterium]
MRIIFKKLTVLFLFFSTSTSFGQGTWIQKASIPFTARWGAIGFAITNRGYVGTGYDGSINYGDFWSYNAVTNSWSQIASIPARRSASAFTIGNYGYVCFGIDQSSNFYNDIWEYDPSGNTWAQKANFPGSARYGAAGFSIGNKGYVACGNEGSAAGPYTNDFWEYDPVTNKWTQKANFPGTPRYGLTCMGWAIGDKGYLGNGVDGYNPYHWAPDFYEYTPATDKWIKKADFPFGGRSYAIAFTSCNKYYSGTGQNGTALDDLWEYDPLTDKWSQMADFGGGNRWLMIGLTIHGNGYGGTGYDFTNYYNDWWMYTCNNTGVDEKKSTPNLTSLTPTVFSDFAILNIDKSINLTTAEVKIFDVQGKEIKREIINTNILKLHKENMKEGIYLYEVLNKGKKIGYGKFIIE